MTFVKNRIILSTQIADGLNNMDELKAEVETERKFKERICRY